MDGRKVGTEAKFDKLAGEPICTHKVRPRNARVRHTEVPNESSSERSFKVSLCGHAGRRQFLVLDPEQNRLSEFAVNVHFRVVSDS